MPVSPVMRYSLFAAFFVCFALMIGNARAADNTDYEIIDPELLKEEDEETAAHEPEANGGSSAEEADDISVADTGSDVPGAGLEPGQTDADAEAVDAAFAALQNQEYETAYDLFYTLAAQDNALAQYELGALYHRGAGVDKDLIRASRWYERSAEQGYGEAQYRLGNMYLMGEGVRQSDTEAAHWLEQAAQQGHAGARDNLAKLQRISTARTREELEHEAASLPPLKVEDKTAGKGKKKKRGFFKRWLGRDEKPVAQPRSPAENPLEQQAVTGSQNPAGSDKTDTAAVKIDDVAATTTSRKKKKGFFSRLLGRGDRQEETTAGAKTSTGDTGSAPSTSGTEVRQPVAVTGSAAVSNYELGMAYALGDSLKQDYAKAFEHFTRSAEQGYAPAQYRLGVAYANGDGTGKDLAKAVEWYEKSARQGHVIAQRSLALIYLNGQDDIGQNKPLALAWYSLLAEDGNQMDIHRRDTLLQELSDAEISLAQGITSEIQGYLTAGKD